MTASKSLGRTAEAERLAAIEARKDFAHGVAISEIHAVNALAESELEKIMGAWLTTILPDFSEAKCDHPTVVGGWDPEKLIPPDNLYLAPQTKVGVYRLDFALFYRIATWTHMAKIAIECDGHEYHDGTKEAAERDKKRNRFLTARGWHVLRFSGREIHRDPEACVREVEALLTALYAGDIRQ